MKRKLIASASALFFIGTLGIGEVFAFGVPGGGKLPGLGGGGGGIKGILFIKNKNKKKRDWFKIYLFF